MTAPSSTDQLCAVCGGTVVDGRCTNCGAVAIAQDVAAATSKRSAIPTRGQESPLPPLSPEDLGMTQPRLTAITRDDLPIITMRTPPPRELAGGNPAPTEQGPATRETKALIEKSIVGTQWIMVAILIGVPLGFVTQIIMGRLSAEALGTYSLMLVLVQAVQTFFLLGGANVIVNFIPRATPREKSALLVSYAGIALGFSVVFFVAMLIFPDALTFLLLHPKNVTTSSLYPFLLIFIPIVIAQTLTIAVLQGEMELGVAARTQYGVQVMTFALTLGLAVLAGGLRVVHDATPLVPLVVLGAYLITFTTGLRALIGVVRRRWQPSWRWYLPPNFWNFTLTFHGNTIVWFFFNNIDQIVIASLYSYGTVGIYRVALAVATYALWAPNLFTGAMYPFFTNLVAKGDFATLKSAYQRYCAITTVIVAFVSLAAGLFAPEIVQLFGKRYAADSLPIMITFSLMYVIFSSAAYVPSTALITAHEDIWLNLILNIASLGTRIGLYGPLTARYGLIGIAYANAISLGVLYIATMVAVGLRYRVSVPLRQHVISLAGGVLLLAPYALQSHLPASHVLQLVVRGLALAIFVGILTQLRLISAADLATVTQRLRRLPVVGKLVARLG